MLNKLQNEIILSTKLITTLVKKKKYNKYLHAIIEFMRTEMTLSTSKVYSYQTNV